MTAVLPVRPPRSAPRSRARQEWKAAPAIAVVVIIYFIPVSFVLINSVTEPEFGFGNYTSILSDPADLRLLATTVGLAVVTSILSIVVGYPLAHAIAHSGRFVSGALMICVMVPFLTSTLIRTFGWQIILNSDMVIWLTGGESLLGTWPAVLIGLVHLTLPLVVLALVVGMREMDSRLSSVGHSLGAGPVATFFRVYFPLTLPAIEIAFVVGFVFSVGSFVTPSILGGHGPWTSMVGSVIYDLVFTYVQWGEASAFAVLLILLCLLIIAAYKWLLGGRVEWLVRRSTGGAGVRKKTAGHEGAGKRTGRLDRRFSAAYRFLDDHASWVPYRVLAKTWAWGVGLLLLLPELFAIPTSFTEVRVLLFPPIGFSMQWYDEFFTSWIDPALISLTLALLGALIVPPLALMAAIAVERSTSRRFRGLTTAIMLTPAIVPPVVAAVGYYLSFLRLGLVDTIFGMVISLSCLSIPYAYVVLSGSIRGLDPTYERAAASLGAGRLMVLRRVMVPMVLTSVLAACGMVFLMVLDESSVSIFLSGFSVKTLSARMFEAVLLESNPTVAVVAALSMALIIAGAIVYALQVTHRARRRA